MKTCYTYAPVVGLLCLLTSSVDAKEPPVNVKNALDICLRAVLEEDTEIVNGVYGALEIRARDVAFMEKTLFYDCDIIPLPEISNEDFLVEFHRWADAAIRSGVFHEDHTSITTDEGLRRITSCSLADVPISAELLIETPGLYWISVSSFPDAFAEVIDFPPTCPDEEEET